MAKANNDIILLAAVATGFYFLAKKTPATTSVVAGIGSAPADSKEWYDMVADFEKIYYHMRLDKEDKKLRKLQRFYQSAETNMLFIAFMHGYGIGRLNYMH